MSNQNPQRVIVTISWNSPVATDLTEILAGDCVHDALAAGVYTETEQDGKYAITRTATLEDVGVNRLCFYDARADQTLLIPTSGKLQCEYRLDSDTPSIMAAQTSINFLLELQMRMEHSIRCFTHMNADSLTLPLVQSQHAIMQSSLTNFASAVQRYKSGNCGAPANDLLGDSYSIHSYCIGGH